ncbi:putative histidine acid phosphatase [Sphaerosporella brunnea]|uniref:3-phytase n=1 Tax=Sphaerosporella brunnea TaxID=1250544 RepID=A0A5J5EHZ5_9PEZI|nr:putative histidine acid phosphatase [Sphaerosporella brunnea]
MKSHHLVALLAFFSSTVSSEEWNVLQHLGANGQWFPGPDIYNLHGPAPPSNCIVEQAAYIVRHGSRYPDPGAYSQWLSLHNKTSSASRSFTGPLSFLNTWEPVLTYPADDIAQVSVTGYQELTTLGATLRLRYPRLYAPNTKFTVWANKYQRVIDSARLFAHGYAGPNASAVVEVKVVDADKPSALANSLAPSNLCQLYVDDSSAETDVWDNVYLPPILKRLRRYDPASVLTTDDLSLFPYLCGFETQITGTRSPFCAVFTKQEIEKYEYRQDLRYWYGNGPESGLAGTMMLPVLKAVTELLEDGPGVSYNGTKGTEFTPNPLVVAFTHDGQINQLASVVGVFDGHPTLPAGKMLDGRWYVSSRITPMRGTVALERMVCGKERYVRILLNDAVYTVPSCKSGPGGSCPLERYVKLVDKRIEAAGSFSKRCNATEGEESGKSFFVDADAEWVSVVKP